MWCKCVREDAYTYRLLYVPQHPCEHQRTNLSMRSHLPHRSFCQLHCTPYISSCHNSTGAPNTSYYTQHYVAAGIQTHAPCAQVLYLLSYLPALFFHSLQQCRLELINKLFQNYFIICVCRYSQKLKEGKKWIPLSWSYRQVQVWVLGTKLNSSVKTLGTFNCWAISQAPINQFLPNISMDKSDKRPSFPFKIRKIARMSDLTVTVQLGIIDCSQRNKLQRNASDQTRRG